MFSQWPFLSILKAKYMFSTSAASGQVVKPEMRLQIEILFEALATGLADTIDRQKVIIQQMVVLLFTGWGKIRLGDLRQKRIQLLW